MDVPARTMQKQPIYIFAARNLLDPQAKRSATYEFYAKIGRTPPELACNYTVVSVLRLPRMFYGLERLLDRTEDGCLGYIKYVFNGSTAITDDYQPKKYAREVSTLGYFFELVSTHDLLKGWADKISTTFSPSPARALRLKYAHLPVGAETDGRAWELGVSAAIRKHVEKLRRLAGMQHGA